MFCLRGTTPLQYIPRQRISEKWGLAFRPTCSRHMFGVVNIIIIMIIIIMIIIIITIFEKGVI